MTLSARPTDLSELSLVALHALECAHVTLRHSSGVRALRPLRALAPLAPERLHKPGFRAKLDASLACVPKVRRACQEFFDTRLPGDTTIGELFPRIRARVSTKLDGLERLPLASIPAAIEAVPEALGEIAAALAAQRHSLREFVESEVPGLASLCEEKRVRLVTRYPASDDPAVFLHPGHLGNALTELVNNALTHAFRDDESHTIRVEVAAGETPDQAVLAVCDDGCGIPDAVLPHLFDRGTTTDGSGEGLALVREIVEQEHLGDLRYVTGDVGTRWEMVLPVKVGRETLRAMLRQAFEPIVLQDNPPGAKRRRVARGAAILLPMIAAVLLGGLGVAWLWSHFRASLSAPRAPGESPPLAARPATRRGAASTGLAPTSSAPAHSPAPEGEAALLWQTSRRLSTSGRVRGNAMRPSTSAASPGGVAPSRPTEPADPARGKAEAQPERAVAPTAVRPKPGDATVPTPPSPVGPGPGVGRTDAARPRTGAEGARPPPAGTPEARVARAPPAKAAPAPATHPAPRPAGPAPEPPATRVPRIAKPPPGLPREMVHAATGIRLVLVPAGTFMMGSDAHGASEAPAHVVTINRPFYLGKFEVTQEQYERLMGANPSRRTGRQRPVERVSFLDCLLFCRRAGLRLPTEAEWEFACHASRARGTLERQPLPVGAGRANRFGLHDMLGNVAEWCADRYGLYEPGGVANPKGPTRGSRRVIRGGSFLVRPADLRPTLRSSLAPTDRRDFIGFRVAMHAPEVGDEERE